MTRNAALPFTAFIFLLFSIAPPIQTASAHPVIYPGGVDITLLNTPIMREWMGSYSIKNWISVGGRFLRLNHAQNTTAWLGTVGLLPWRGNFETSQANFYLTAGAGIESTLYTQKWIGLISPEVDWENRFLLFSAKYTALPGSVNSPSDLLRLRAAVAAYEGQTDELNVWLMLQADYHTIDPVVLIPVLHPSQEVLRWQWTPMLRVTYKSTLFELGVSDNGATHVNMKAHF